MISFNEWLQSEAVNSHSTHLEDLVLARGQEGAKIALAALEDIAKSIGTSTGVSKLSTKLDGAPAIIAGWTRQGFFVSTKSAFNKVPIYNYTKDEIKANHPGYLYDVLSTALELLPKVYPKGKIYQGDLLYIKQTLKSVRLNGKDCWAWHPNTIQYSVEKNSKLGMAVAASKMGIGVHTEYVMQADDRLTLKGFGVDTSVFPKSRDVFVVDTKHRAIGDMDKLSGSDAARFWTLWKDASSIRIMDFGKWSTDLMAFVNSYIRSGRDWPMPKIMASEFEAHILAKYKREAGKVKKPENVNNVLAKGDAIANEIRQLQPDMEQLFRLFKLIAEMKGIIIKKIESVKDIGTFALKSDGTFEVTGDEGYVLTGSGAAGVKLVDRLQFSTMNFSKDIVKGFER
jgi:hypothetical protein